MKRFAQTLKLKLEAMSCTPDKIHAELYSFLMVYRKIIHPATGKSPAMLVLEQNLNFAGGEITHAVVREFKVNDRVRVREYAKSEKWVYGAISESIGKLRYVIKLDDGRSWRRHVDQISGTGSLAGIDTENRTEFIEFVNDDSHVVDTSIALPTNTSEPEVQIQLQDQVEPEIQTSTIEVLKTPKQIFNYYL